MSPLAPPGMMRVSPFEQQDNLDSKKLKVSIDSDNVSYVRLKDCCTELYGQVFLFDKKQDLLKECLIRLRGKVSVIDDVILGLSVGERVANIAFHIRDNAYYVSFNCVDGVEYK